MGPDTNGREAVPASFLLTRAVDALVRFCGLLSAILILVILAIVIYAITQRYVFDTPLLWGDELNGYLLVAMIMLGGAEALRRGDHIAIDLLTGRAKGTPARLLAIWGNLAVLAFSSVLGWSAWTSIMFAYDFGSYSPGYLEVAMWIPHLPILIGAVLLALTALTRIIEPPAPETPVLTKPAAKATSGPDTTSAGTGRP
jgi:TRAP-type C4-dicarboxylate transport system permease small subunit